MKFIFAIGTHKALSVLGELTASPGWQGGDEATCDALLKDTLSGWWVGDTAAFETWWGDFDTSDLTHAQQGSDLHIALIAHCYSEELGTEAFITDATQHGTGNVTFGEADNG